MTEALDKLDQETRDRFFEYLGVSDVSELSSTDQNHDEVLVFFEEQVGALMQELETVRTRLDYLLEQLPQYIQQAGGEL
ncbi:hypothetical protein [Actinokineospora sp. HUAS TT18]|uniref:hypothetical protein n=1 Tax=Actinokineospora sp. HUAS TT18 TaxID=3447451 RepID=UPI003F521E5D